MNNYQMNLSSNMGLFGQTQNYQGDNKEQNNYISESEFQQCKGFIGNRPLIQVHQHFAQIGTMVQKILSEKKLPSQYEKREKEVRVGPIVFKPSRGDWKCPQENCKNWNYSKRSECNLCKKSRDQQKIDDDWKCQNCGFQNKSTRNECYKCNVPKS